MRRTAFVACAVLLAALAGCGKSPGSDTAAARRGVQPNWDAAANPFVVQGWKSGDRASWEGQLSARAQNQNEYLRVR